MDVRAHETTEVRARAERFQWPLGLAAVALLLHLALPPFGHRPRRTPTGEEPT